MKNNDLYTETFSFTQEDVITFARVTGDTNPIHLDAEYAAGTMFKKPIMHGFLGGAVISRVLGTKFPGYGTIYMSQTLKFLAPMYVDTEYTIRVEAVEVLPEKHRATLSVVIEDSATGKATITGEAKVMNTEVIR